MAAADLLELYEYGYWANRKLLDAASTLTPEEFTQTVAGSYGSIRNTLVHAVSAEWGWLGRCGAQPDRGARLSPEGYPTFDVVDDLYRKVEGIGRQFLSTLNDTELTRVVEFSLVPPDTHRLTVDQILRHGAIHSIHHRGQASLLIRMLGHTPGNFDAQLLVEGKISPQTFEEWNRETGSKRLPEHVKRKKSARKRIRKTAGRKATKRKE